MSPVLTVQRRMMQLGKIRLGEKGARGEPRKLETFRFTSASKQLLDAVAAIHGGTVRVWEGAPDEGYFEVTTNARELNIILPPVFSAVDGTPTAPYSQWMELWSGGGCQRRCDGVTESLSGKACLCKPDERECKITTRISLMLPEIPGLGVWVCESHGWNAAAELPGTLEALLLAASEARFIPAVLRAEQRTKKTPGEPTKKFVVPVIDLPHARVGELLSGDTPNALAINPPAARPAEKPALPAAGNDLPVDPSFGKPETDEGTAGWGAPPETPKLFLSAEQAEELATLRDTLVAAGALTDAQFEKGLKRDYKTAKLEDLSPAQAVELTGRLQAKLQPAEEQSAFTIPETAR